MQRLRMEKVVGVGYRGGARGLKKTEGRQGREPPCHSGIPAPRSRWAWTLVRQLRGLVSKAQRFLVSGGRTTAVPKPRFSVLFFDVLAHPAVFPGKHYIDSQPFMFSPPRFPHSHKRHPKNLAGPPLPFGENTPKEEGTGHGPHLPARPAC